MPDNRKLAKALWNPPDTEAWSQRNTDALNSIMDINQFLPVTGDIQSGVQAASDLKNKKYASALLNSAGLLPFVPALGGVIKGSKLINIPLSEIEHGESAMPGGKLTWPSAKETIKKYANMKTELPPIEVVSNDADSLIPWMIYDGSHRYEAAKLKGMKSIPAYVSPYDVEGLNLAKKYKLD